MTIFMCTFNGEQFLAQQLDSIANQTFANWSVIVSDDGSTDGTLEILQRYRDNWGEEKLDVRQGPRRGFAANFLSVTCSVRNRSHFYAWADQDDIWRNNKLEAALSVLQRYPSDTPLLYSARTELIDGAGSSIGFSPAFKRAPSFANALVQSIGGGNTMVFNSQAHDLLLHAGPDLDIVAHDWWVYLLVAGVGGEVVHDLTPTLLYRQHDANIIGSNTGWGARVVRLRTMFNGRSQSWNDRNIAALSSVSSRMSPENGVRFECFRKARSSKLIRRFLYLKRCGIYRQTVLGNLGLFLAALLGKL
ncbi:glycosyltransferase family 2 protein [Pseudomonas syringae group sp. J309-1]|uniref:glycosyltransferase family 2 protein n=1 Tax=Pseudomonas syringae group sp. J309-1 TaxID=3079588 RepID=UPI0029073DAC|nr:glycosyltransferase family 2 protein [Pseudomonas syringae group sp. J309-1]MDU8362135.1 glycosyltransferase family 2 protein [Pseudomonas syringae group sp. J309-1]